MVAVACDLDGTIVDTHEALRQAYGRAGVFWEPTSRPWTEWCTPRQHDEKIAVYPEMLAKYASLTPFGRVAPFENWIILTGASGEAVDAIRTALDLDLKHAYFGQTIKSKIVLLETWDIKLYFDDDPKMVDLVNERLTSCTAILIK